MPTLLPGIWFREINYPPSATKGSELTWTELDTNQKILMQEIQKLNTADVSAYDSGDLYSQPKVVRHISSFWKFLGAPATNAAIPGTNPAVWLEINIGALIHEKNKETILAAGTLSEVSAAEIREFIDVGGFVKELSRAAWDALSVANPGKRFRGYDLTNEIYIKGKKDEWEND